MPMHARIANHMLHSERVKRKLWRKQVPGQAGSWDMAKVKADIDMPPNTGLWREAELPQRLSN